MPYDLNSLSDEMTKTGDSQFFSVPKEGSKVFFCWHESQKRPYQEVHIHYNIIQGKIACLKQFGQVCPICEANNELFNMKNDLVAQQLSKEIYAKKSFLYNLIPDVEVKPMQNNQGVIYYTKQDTPKVKTMLMGIKLHRLLGSFLAFHGNIFDPKGGNLIQLSKMLDGTSDPKFASTFATPHPLKCVLHENLMALMNNLPDLTKIFEPQPFDQLKLLVDQKLANFRATRSISVPNTVRTVAQIAPVASVVEPPRGVVIGSSVPVVEPPKKVAGTVDDLDAFERSLMQGKK